MLKAIVLTFILALECTVYAHQPKDGVIHATGAFYLHRNTVRDHDFEAPVLTGAGVIAEGDIDHHGGPELSIFYLRQFYSIQKDGYVLNALAKRLYVIAGYRHWFSTRLSAAGGLYSSYAMGDPRVVHTEFQPGQNPKTSAHDSVDYGFDFSLQFEPVRWRTGGVVVDARYSRSVTSKPGEAADFYGATIGLKFLVQQRTPTVETSD